MKNNKDVEKSFKNALKDARDVAMDKEFKVCCCAHSHHENCKWFKIYKQDPAAAHAMHSTGDCNCNKTRKKE